ncbi:MAG: helix-turn-helix domain-containing protein [Christensenellaceae bacterium]|jgi:mannose-6-phosphate isomerase-like protein (cupin superfamily)
MNEQVIQIAARIRELRDILEVAPEAIAQKTGLSLDEYCKYENAELDIPIGVLYAIAAELRVDPTELLTGEAPRMDNYTIVRAGHGVRVERYDGYEFSSLAFNFKRRDMEPLLVTLSPNNEAELVTHGGQEFNYVLEGKMRIVIGNRDFILEQGDSIYFNPAVPHGQRAVGGEAKFLTIINE